MTDNSWLLPYQGAFENGYTPEDLTTFFRQVLTRTGVELVCVWDGERAGELSGDSEWYVLDETSTVDEPVLRNLAGNLWPFLFEAPDSSVAVTDPGDPSSWAGSVARLGPTRWSSTPGSLVLTS